MVRRLMFNDDYDEDAIWGPVRILGAGSYGQVGLWQKRNDLNQPIDELALKENAYNPNALLPSEVSPIMKLRMPKEALIQHDINDKDDRAAPFLRRYKFISESADHEQGRYRHYLEFCPHDSLQSLSALYRAWDTYLPEVFLWYVFHRLAISCQALHETPPLDSLAWSTELDGLARRNGYCLHLDMKPGNVLLDYAPEDPQDHDFPGPKLSDYGMSVYTCSDDQSNPIRYFWRATRVYAPPEQQSYGAHWTLPPTGAAKRTHDEQRRRRDFKQAKAAQRDDNREDEADITFDTSTNIYGVGATMYTLLTLRRPERLQETRAKTIQKFVRNGNHQISGVRTKTPGIYSSRLRSFLSRCIDPNPDARPTQLELLDATRRGLRLAERRLRKKNTWNVAQASNAQLIAAVMAGAPPNDPDVPTHSEKLYFKGHEINDMPLGDAGFRPSKSEIKYLAIGDFVDPDRRRLRLPAAKYGHYPAPSFVPGWKKLYDESNGDPAWFNDPFVAPPPPQNANAATGAGAGTGGP
ncbi:kinase-like domain-containing protein [Exophiala viscosa]|uniref:kinase-like domain-containing protein n=1 Tax=Exophiala viscosa TaxID=2486360 RepID=UPI0021907FDC|nr:kinase-like domain-containing protein [Exophiala viscosa]